MISVNQAKKFCKDYTQIENYEVAKNDPNTKWECHPAVQEALKSLFQYHNLKASILWYSAFSMVQLTHPDYSKDHSFDHTRQNYNLTYGS